MAAGGPRVLGTTTGSYAAAVAESVRIVRASGLPHETNAMFTNLEGDWDEVMAVLKQCVDAMTADHPRVSLVVKADIRPGHAGQLAAEGRPGRAPARRRLSPATTTAESGAVEPGVTALSARMLTGSRLVHMQSSVYDLHSCPRS